MDLQLTEKLTALSVTMDFIQKAQEAGFKATNDHLAQLNGKILKQERELDSHSRRLGDFESFKDAVDASAKSSAGIEAKKIAERSAGIRSIIVSVATFILIALAAAVLIKFFHFNPFTGLRQQ